MKDKKTLFAFVLLILLIVFLIYLVLQKKADDISRDTKIDGLANTVQALNTKLTELKSIQGIDGKTPVKGVDYSDGAPGKDGKNGVDGKNGRDGKDGRDGVDGKPGLPAPELEIGCVANKLMKKYTGDDFWQPTDIKCEVDHE